LERPFLPVLPRLALLEDVSSRRSDGGRTAKTSYASLHDVIETGAPRLARRKRS
jgi:hypothetical protein